MTGNGLQAGEAEQYPGYNLLIRHFAGDLTLLEHLIH
jgi:hypothetical protein